MVENEMESFPTIVSAPLLDTIRRTIEERNLLTARSRLKYVSALRKACLNNSEKAIAARIEKLKWKVIQELLSSEKSYLKQIGWIVTEFKLTLEIHSVLGRKEMDLLFGNIELIKTLNEAFYKELKASEDVCQAFHKFAPMLKIYSAYARNYQQAIETLQSTIAENAGAASIIKEKEEVVKAKLMSLLITPIQRIPRYKLLLEQLLSFSKADEPNTSVQASVDTINDVAQHMNEMVRSFENSKKILEITNFFKKNLPFDLVQPGRMLIKNGIVRKPANNHRRYLILFNDQIYFCKMKTGSKVKLYSPLVVPLQKCIVNQNGEVILIHCATETPVMFTTANPDELAEWHKTIVETITTLKQRVCTLRKESSRILPMRIGKDTPKRSESSQPKHDTPRKLKRVLNISSCLDEIVDFLSPKRKRRTEV